MPSFGIYIYTIHTGSVCFNSLPENHDWFDVGSAKKRANKNKLLEKKNITVNGFRTKCERVFFPAYFAWALIIMKAFVSHFICISYSGQQRITYRTKISVSHSFQMNGKKAYKLLLSDNSISILLRSSAVQHA